MKLANQFAKQNDDYNSIMIKALADRLAEAFAEYLHQEVRTKYWYYAPSENLSNDALIKEQYKGIRPAPGYPACPDHLEKETIWEILNVKEAHWCRTYRKFSHVASSECVWILFWK